jgi:Pyoverdine/dityrosine biosynthesis protein
MTLDSESLRDVLSTAKPSARGTTIADGRLDRVKRIFQVLLSSRVRKGSLVAMDAEGFLARHHDRVAARLARNEPVQLTLVGFPFKVPNPLKVGGRAIPDLAEVGALMTLEQLHLDVQRVYAPGIEVVILHDGAYIANAFGVPRRETYEYTRYFQRLLQATGTDGFIRCEDLVYLLGSHRRKGAAQTAPPRARDGDTAAFRKTLGMLNVRWVPREILPRVYEQLRHGDPASFAGDAAILYREVRRSMARYAACDDFLHRFDPRPCVFPEAIHATTKTRPGRLALWLVRRGRSLLPWHGVGVLDRTGRIEVRHAAELETDREYRRVFIDGETTPFFYQHTACHDAR